jgi:2-iminoacetate synthase ThiH
VGDDELVPVEEPDPSDSMLRRAKKKMDDYKWVEPLIRYAVIAALGTGAGMASHKVEDAKEVAQHSEGVSELKALQQEVRELREGLLQRVSVEEREREEAAKKHEHRLTRIETLLEVRMGVAPMPAAEAARPTN